LASVYDDIRAGGELLSIAPQPIENNQDLRRRRSLPFPILADYDQAVIRDWGLFDALDPKERPIPYPAAYIISQNGRITWAYLGAGTRDRPTVGEIMAAFRKTHQQGPANG
jgi:peroxiredoxin